MKNKTDEILLENSASYLIYRLALRIRTLYQRAIQENGGEINPEQLALLMNLSKKEGVSQKELAQNTLSDTPAVTRMIDKLEKLDLIERRDCKGDKRAYQIYFTAKGKKTRAELASVTKSLNILFKGFSNKEKKNFFELLLKLKENVESNN